MVWHFLRLADARRRHGPKGHSQELCRAALDVAESLPAGAVPEPILSDLKAESWAGLANALKVAGELRAAMAAWDKAEGFAALGTGDPLMRANFHWKRASLLGRMGRGPEAEALLREAVDLFTLLGEQHSAGCCRLTLSILLRDAARPAEALAEAAAASGELDERIAPDLFLSTLYNQTLYLGALGHGPQALALLMELKPRFLADGQPEIPRLRLLWLEGRLRAQLGQRVRGRALLQQARAGFLVQGMPLDAAQVCLELASSYAADGAMAEVERLAEEMYPVFSGQGLPAEASSALMLFYRAVEQRTATAELLRQLCQRMAQHEPSSEPPTP